MNKISDFFQYDPAGHYH